MSKKETSCIHNAITLRELKKCLPSTKGAKRPTPKGLRESTAQVILQSTSKGGDITVYDNGFAVYISEGHYCVLRVDVAGEIKYKYSLNKQDCIEVVSTEDELWDVALFLDGEERLEAQCQKRIGRVLSITGSGVMDDESEEPCDLEIDSGVDIVNDYIRKEEQKEDSNKVKKIMNQLTEKQQRVLELRFYEEKTLKEIANEMGITKQSVNEIIQRAINKSKKFNKFFKTP